MEDMSPWYKKEQAEDGVKCHRRSRQGSGSGEGDDRTKKGSRKEKSREITELEGVYQEAVCGVVECECECEYEQDLQGTKSHNCAFWKTLRC